MRQREKETWSGSKAHARGVSEFEAHLCGTPSCLPSCARRTPALVPQAVPWTTVNHKTTQDWAEIMMQQAVTKRRNKATNHTNELEARMNNAQCGVSAYIISREGISDLLWCTPIGRCGILGDYWWAALIGWQAVGKGVRWPWVCQVSLLVMSLTCHDVWPVMPHCGPLITTSCSEWKSTWRQMYIGESSIM